MATGRDRTGSRHSEQSLPDPLHFVHILAAEVRLARNPDCSDCSRADFRLLIPTSDCSFPTSDCCEGFRVRLPTANPDFRLLVSDFRLLRRISDLSLRGSRATEHSPFRITFPNSLREGRLISNYDLGQPHL